MATNALIEGASPDLRARLEVYVALLRKWNSAINLVSRQSLEEVWSRHIADSLQVAAIAPKDATRWVDMGSGGGLPGVVVALAWADTSPSTEFVLIEADQRKSEFLKNVSRETGVRFRVMAERIETTAPQHAQVLSARALAPLDDLLGFSERHLNSEGVAIFPKGETADLEVAEARRNWEFDLEEVPSRTDPKAKLLLIRSLKRA